MYISMNGVWVFTIASFLFSAEAGFFKRRIAASTRTQETFVKTKFPLIFGKSAIRRLIEGNGYGYENYTITTVDGYILNLNRIIHPNTTGSHRGYPLLLVNGFFMQSEAWFAQYRLDSNIAFVLANHGYDVWLGDQRGSMRSKRHVNLTTEDVKFWDFSYHESGMYDISAFIDFILKKTRYDDLIYSCMSLGCAFHAVLASKLPSYNQKIRAAVYFVPIANNVRHIHSMSSIMHLSMRFSPLAVGIYEKAYHDWLPFLGDLKKEVYHVCRPIESFPTLVKLGVKLFFGSAYHIPLEAMCFSGALSLGGSNPKSTKHLIQAFESGDFAEYDYGREENKVKYGTEWSPLYNMSKITSPVALYFSDADLFTDPKKIGKTVKSLGGPTYTCKLPGFNHLDVAAGSNFRFVLPDIIDLFGSLAGYNNHTKKFKSGNCPSMEWIRNLQ